MDECEIIEQRATHQKNRQVDCDVISGSDIASSKYLIRIAADTSSQIKGIRRKKLQT